MINLFANLDDDMVVHIVEFLNQEEALEAALVSKQVHRGVEKASTAALTRIEEQKVVDEDFWFRIRQYVNAQDDNNHRISLSRLLSPPPSRILLKAARIIAVKQSTTEHQGPCTLLPDGNIAIWCHDDGLMRIFDTSLFQFSFCEQRPVQFGPAAFMNKLFYSNGHLILHSTAVMVNETNFSVWELEYGNPMQIRAVRFRRHIRLEEYLQDYAVAENGNIYVLLNHGEDEVDDERCQEIEVHDIATGKKIQTVQCSNIPECEFLFMSATHLLLVRNGADEDEDEDDDEAGIFALDMENELSLKSVLSDFGKYGFRRHLMSCCNVKGCIIYEDLTWKIRTISIDDDGILRQQEGGIRLGERNNLEYIASASRVFLGDLDGVDGILKVDEFDFTIGKKVRTISTEIPVETSRNSIHSVMSNDTAVFCIIQNSNNHLVIQRFLL